MREIKLRIRLKNRQDGQEITLLNSVFDAMTGIAFYEIDRSEWLFIGADKYTGLIDKNGVDIYEGDICKKDRQSELYEVVFYKGAWAIKNETERAIWHQEFCNGANPKQLEVIGNIHQNLDLLENGK